jgi:hypothetical protein
MSHLSKHIKPEKRLPSSLRRAAGDGSRMPDARGVWRRLGVALDDKTLVFRRRIF